MLPGISRVSINTGTGDDGVLLQGQFFEPVIVSTAAGTDVVRAGNIIGHNDLRFVLGGGDDDAAIGRSWTILAPMNITFVGGAGFDALAESPSTPLVTAKSIELSTSGVFADAFIDDAGLAVSLSYVLRGGDPTDLPC